MRRRVPVMLPLCAAILAGVALSAGTAVAQSPLSLVNLGAPIPNQDARMAGRGGWGLAESDTLAPAFKNLASLPGLNRLAVLLSGFGERVHSLGDAGARTNYRVMTPNIRAAVPLRSGRLVFTAGFLSQRSTQYEDTLGTTLFVGSPVETVSASRRFAREGTQYVVPIGAAWRIAPRLSASASLNLARGMIRETVIDAFNQFSAGGSRLFRSSVLVREDQIHGTSLTFGLRAQPLDGLALGAVFTPAYDWGVDRTLELVGVGAKADTAYTWRYPMAWGAGATCRVAPRWRVGADYELTQFSKFRGPSDWQGQNVDEWALSFGLERQRAQIRRGGIANLPLRLGASVRRWGYLVGGADVRETRLSIGTGFPFRGNGGAVDVAVSYGWAGDQATNGYTDRVWRLSISAVGLEKWW